MKNIITVVTIIFTGVLSAQTMNKNMAINKLADQKMLCYKIAKNYLSIGAGIKTAASRKELDEAIAGFNASYESFLMLSKEKKSRATLAEIGENWSRFRSNAMLTPDQKSATDLIKDANFLAKLCDIFAESIIAHNDTKAEEILYVCGNESMLSQKMAMYYMANYWSIPCQGLATEMSETIASFETNLNILINSNANSLEINKILKEQKDEWPFIIKSFDLEAKKQIPISVLSSSNLMLKNFELASVMYKSVGEKTIKF